MSLLRILLLEDNSNDARVVMDLLDESDFECEVTLVQTREDFMAALGAPEVDLTTKPNGTGMG